MRQRGNVWDLPQGQLLLPRVFGFCRGVERALTMLQDAVDRHRQETRQIFLLGEIIHNPWVNEYFNDRGVRILPRGELEALDRHITREDCAVVPAFGVPLEVERRLRRIGCEIVDTSCGDVRRLWIWGEKAVARGYAILIFGLPHHDETVVTKSRLAAAGGKYLVVENLSQARLFADFISGAADAATFNKRFGDDVTNARSVDAFTHLAQLSQTTMLYDETMAVRDIITQTFAKRFDADELSQRLLSHPTVCRATQNRQSAAVALCSDRCDLAVVVGGFGSSNTRHLYELASTYTATVFIEGAEAIESATRLHSIDETAVQELVISDWLPRRRPLRIAVLAGASCPEIVIGQVLSRLAEFLR